MFRVFGIVARGAGPAALRKQLHLQDDVTEQFPCLRGDEAPPVPPPSAAAAPPAAGSKGRRRSSMIRMGAGLSDAADRSDAAAAAEETPEEAFEDMDEALRVLGLDDDSRSTVYKVGLCPRHMCCVAASSGIVHSLMLATGVSGPLVCK